MNILFLERFLPAFSPNVRSTQLQQQGDLAIAVARQSVRLRAQQARDGLIAIVGAAGVITMIYSFFVPAWRLLGWMPLIVFAQLLNHHVSKKILQRIAQDSVLDIARSERRLMLISWLAAFAIGTGVWWIGWRNDLHVIWYSTTIVQCVYAIGDTADNSTNVPSALISIWTNLILAAIFWALPGGASVAAATSIVSLAIFLSGYARYFKNNFAELIRIRFENLELVRKLEIEKQAAEQANLAKSRFLAAASHDLRQPLHALMLFSGMLHTCSAEQTQTLNTYIRSAADSLNKLFGGLLDLSQLDAGSVHPKLASVQMRPLITSLIDEYRPRAALKSIALKSAIDTDIAVKTDPFLFERVLRNLVDNALKYTDSGSVTISVCTCDNRVQMTVTDTGIGIADTLQEKIFDEFFQLHNPARNIEKGTGLGLAIVQRLCDLLDHRLVVKSEVGRGSEFSIYLEPSDTHYVAAPLIVSTDGGVIPEHLFVVVIDDDARVRIAMEGLLTSWRCRAGVYESCVAALAHLTEIAQVPDALIADFRLGDGINGFDVIAQFREYFGPALPAAIFTGDTEAHFRYTRILPDVPVFQKPVEPKEIAQWLVNETASATLPVRA